MDLTNLEIAAKRLIEAVKNKQEVLIYGDVDVDGLTTSLLYKTFFLNLDFNNFTFSKYKERVHSIPISVVNDIDEQKPDLVLISDTGSSQFELLNTLANVSDVIVADHHTIEENQPDLVENVILVNPTGLDDNPQLSGGCVVYEIICKAVDLLINDEVQGDILKNNFHHLALISLYSDVIYDDNYYTRNLHACATVAQASPYFDHLRYRNSRTGVLNELPISKRNITFSIAPGINACFRQEEFELINNFFLNRDQYQTAEDSKHLLEQMKTIRDTSRETAINIKDVIIKNTKEDKLFNSSLVVINLDSYDLSMYKDSSIINYTGLVATKISEYTGKAVCVHKEFGDRVFLSVRDPEERDTLKVFKRYFKEAGGHKSAFGASIDIDTFKKGIRYFREIDKKLSKLTEDRVERIGRDLKLSNLDYNNFLYLCRENEFIKSNRLKYKVHLDYDEYTKLVTTKDGPYGLYSYVSIMDKRIYIKGLEPNTKIEEDEIISFEFVYKNAKAGELSLCL